MSDPHEQANVQQIEWLLGALADTQAQGQPLTPPPSPDTPAPEPDVTTEPDDLH